MTEEWQLFLLWGLVNGSRDRRRLGPARSTAHQLGAATAAWGAGFIRNRTGEYTAAFLAAGGLALVAAVAVPLIRRAGRGVEAPLPVPMS